MRDAALKKRIVAIAEHYGWSSQSNIAIEEMSELTKELCKKSRLSGTFTPVEGSSDLYVARLRFEDNHIIEKLADVQIMIWQLSCLLGEDAEMWIRKAIEQKVLRQMERIKKEGDEI